ncbi:M1 family metallopeptidase [Oceanihabitans sediminis]|uniref:M1 family metallopeptidase n=1 Tax=Oceanihabitans sediminis TaxID=1812012 RepID=UPI00299E90AE|nr:M1 family metallopeptidase [Oceanihabitans sediminis]MDX1774585.1 M1 family metallopeptidase [Oceanihabitans sediminis]
MKNVLFLITCFIASSCLSQKNQSLFQDQNKFTKQDTLRGSITPEREWWDLTYYHLDIKVQPEEKFISGKNTIQYTVLKENNTLQVDLQSPLQITKVTQNNKELEVEHQGNAHFIKLQEKQNIGEVKTIDVYYEGKPKEAVNAPWDGGLSWKKDKNNNHFIATSCQRLGASVWWPNKDHMYDEVDSMLISVTNPKGLTNISNGRLRDLVVNKDNTVTSHWFVSNPINNYGVNINIGDYVHFSEVYAGEKGDLDMDYFVLRDNLEKAKKHFKDAPKMIEAFEHWFGPYPFYEDGFKLVEAPYLGMEHQSSITYGNKYKKGYLGNDLSGTGEGLKFDFIIIHESGHEWFANNITNKDIADMWIHESFTAYSENLFLDYHFGKESSAKYVIGTRRAILNDKPIIGAYHVNNEGSSDMYYKGANMLHTLRQLVEDDEKWRQILRGLNQEFYHQTVNTEQIENYLSKHTGIDLTAFFNQYLRDVRIPTLEYKIEDSELKFRWTNIVIDFDMPIQIKLNGIEQWIYPNKDWKSLKLQQNKTDVVLDEDFYIKTKLVTW